MPFFWSHCAAFGAIRDEENTGEMYFKEQFEQCSIFLPCHSISNQRSPKIFSNQLWTSAVPLSPVHHAREFMLTKNPNPAFPSLEYIPTQAPPKRVGVPSVFWATSTSSLRHQSFPTRNHISLLVLAFEYIGYKRPQASPRWIFLCFIASCGNPGQKCFGTFMWCFRTLLSCLLLNWDPSFRTHNASFRHYLNYYWLLKHYWFISNYGPHRASFVPFKIVF